MKKAKFIFMSNEKELINETVEYEEENGYFSFSLDDSEYRLDTKNFKFIKTKDDEEFVIYDKSGLKAQARLLKENIEVDIKVLYFEKKFEDRKYTIKYRIESDEDSIKTIILSLD